MAKRLIDTEMWKKPWYRKLKAQYKCLWNYLLSNCNHAGIWDVDFDLASFQIGEIVKEGAAKEYFADQVLIFDKGRKWLILGFIRFQYGENLSEKSPVHKKVIDTLKGIYHNGHTLYDTLLHTLSNRGKEKEEDKEEEKEKEKEEEGESPVLELYPTFEDFWNLYDKKIDRSACEKKWKNLKQRDREAIMEYIPSYKAANPDKQFRKNPESFFNAKAWENEIIESSSGNGWNHFAQANINSSNKLYEYFRNEEDGGS